MSKIRDVWRDTGWPMVAFLVATVVLIERFTFLLAVSP